MTNKEAIRILNDKVLLLPTCPDIVREAVYMAIEALEKQIPILEACKSMKKQYNQSGKDWLDERDIPVLEKAIEVCKKEVPKLTADDIETIRIHLNAFKEKLCNQCRWNEAKEYEDLIDRLLSTSSAQPEQKTGKWLIRKFGADAQCSECKTFFSDVYDMENSDNYCRHCGAKMEGLKVITSE